MHNIEYFSYDENIKRDWVKQRLDAYVAQEDWQEGCSGLYRDIRWLHSAGVLVDHEAAEKYIADYDRKDYDNLAVRFYEYTCPDTKALQALESRQKAAAMACKEKGVYVYASGLKADYVGCKACGSKLARKYLRTNRCPVCQQDMRPESLMKELKTLKERYDKARDAVNAYIRDHGKKKVMWLVKIEYHT